jgi:hypothetical protein
VVEQRRRQSFDRVSVSVVFAWAWMIEMEHRPLKPLVGQQPYLTEPLTCLKSSEHLVDEYEGPVSKILGLESPLLH